MTTHIVNAVIEGARITNGDHGVLSAWLTLDYGTSHQGFGGHALFHPGHKEMASYDCAGKFIWRCLEVAGVEEWSQLVGKTIRVRKNDEWSSPIDAIGHIVKDVWFCPKEELK